MKVQSIFKTLIIIVVCVFVGAFILNAVMPNVLHGVTGTIEQQLVNATGLSFDINGDGEIGVTAAGTGNKENTNAGVTGFTP